MGLLFSSILVGSLGYFAINEIQDKADTALEEVQKKGDEIIEKIQSLINKQKEGESY